MRQGAGPHLRRNLTAIVVRNRLREKYKTGAF